MGTEQGGDQFRGYPGEVRADGCLGHVVDAGLRSVQLAEDEYTHSIVIGLEACISREVVLIGLTPKDAERLVAGTCKALDDLKEELGRVPKEPGR